jgi:hypothetical protein
MEPHDPNPDPFYAWLDYAGIRELVHSALELSPGERLVLIKGLVPGLVEAMGLGDFERFVEEVRTKAWRFEEARTHPGEGSGMRKTPGEALGGPTPEGHAHLAGSRNPRRPGGRDAERRLEAEAWGRPSRSGRDDPGDAG